MDCSGQFRLTACFLCVIHHTLYGHKTGPIRKHFHITISTFISVAIDLPGIECNGHELHYASLAVTAPNGKVHEVFPDLG